MDPGKRVRFVSIPKLKFYYFFDNRFKVLNVIYQNVEPGTPPDAAKAMTIEAILPLSIFYKKF